MTTTSSTLNNDLAPNAASASAGGEHPGGSARRWLKRAGIAGFAFFFLKGVAWLVVFAIAAMKITGA